MFHSKIVVIIDLKKKLLKQLQDIEFWYSEENGPESLRDECCPGKPHIAFTKGVMLNLDNPQPHSGFYSRRLLIQEGDTVESVIEKLKIQFKTLGDQVINRTLLINVTIYYYLLILL